MTPKKQGAKGTPQTEEERVVREAQTGSTSKAWGPWQRMWVWGIQGLRRDSREEEMLTEEAGRRQVMRGWGSYTTPSWELWNGSEQGRDMTRLVF